MNLNDLVKKLKWGAGCLALLILAGCGGGKNYELAPVTGKVTCQGKPVPGGQINFSLIGAKDGENIPAAYAMIDEDGNFELHTLNDKGAPVGRHRVSVSLPERDQIEDLESEVKLLEAEGDDPEDLEERKAELEAARRLIDIPCRRVKVSEVTVNPGEDNTFEIELVSGGGGDDDEDD